MDIIFACQDRVRCDEQRESILLLIRHHSHLSPEVRGVVIAGILLGIVVLVLQHLQGINHTGSHQRLVEERNLGILLHVVNHTGIGVLKHHIDRMHNTILYRVVFCTIIDMGGTIQIYHRIAVSIESMGNLDVTTVHVGSMQRTIRHFNGRIHIGHQVCTGNGVTVCIGQLIQRAFSALLQIGIHCLIVGRKAGVMTVC